MEQRATGTQRKGHFLSTRNSHHHYTHTLTVHHLCVCLPLVPARHCLPGIAFQTINTIKKPLKPLKPQKMQQAFKHLDPREKIERKKEVSFTSHFDSKLPSILFCNHGKKIRFYAFKGLWGHLIIYKHLFSLLTEDKITRGRMVMHILF